MARHRVVLWWCKRLFVGCHVEDDEVRRERLWVRASSVSLWWRHPVRLQVNSFESKGLQVLFWSYSDLKLYQISNVNLSVLMDQLSDNLI